MSALSLNLPRGYRFRPTDEELIDHYLRSKNTGKGKELDFIRELPFFKQEPWDLPDLSGLETKDPEWFFFSPQDLKNPNGNRLNRMTNAGYWKVTGKDQEILSGASLIGMKKILVFYEGRTPKGRKTDWVMHEYHTALGNGTKPGHKQNTFVLCRLFDKHKKSLKQSKFNKPASAVECGDNNFNASAAENQVAEVTDTEVDLQLVEEVKMVSDLIQNPLDCNPLSPLTSLPNNDTPAVSSPTTAKSSLEKAESELALASVSPKMQVEVDSNVSYVPPEPLDWSFLSPLHSQIQEVYDPFCMSYSSYLDDELPFQYGTNEPAAFTSELWGDPMPNYPDEFLHNDPSSQKDLAFDSDTMENMGVIC